MKFRILMLERGGVFAHTISPALRLWWRRLLSEFDGCKNAVILP